jgi:hypothetical protein
LRRAVPLLLLVVVLAGCGGGSDTTAGFDSHDLGGGWEVLWKPDGSRALVQRDGDEVARDGIALRVLGPDRGETTGKIPQIAAEISATAAIADYTLLLDGTPLDVKGGGVSPRRITVYGAPASSLSSGRHVVVAAARAGDSAAATAWTFSVR